MRTEVPLRGLYLSVFTETKFQCSSKPVALWCCNNGWEIFMNGAVKFLKLLVLRICSLEVEKKAILSRIYECVFNSK